MDNRTIFEIVFFHGLASLSRGVTLPLGCLDAGVDFLSFNLRLLFGQFAAIYSGRHFEALRGKELN